MEFSGKGGLIREWRRRDSFEETDSSDRDAVDPLEQTTNPRELAAAVLYAWRHQSAAQKLR